MYNSYITPTPDLAIDGPVLFFVGLALKGGIYV